MSPCGTRCVTASELGFRPDPGIRFMSGCLKADKKTWRFPLPGCKFTPLACPSAGPS
jgi:hypothetical protein